MGNRGVWRSLSTIFTTDSEVCPEDVSFFRIHIVGYVCLYMGFVYFNRVNLEPINGNAGIKIVIDKNNLNMDLIEIIIYDL